MILDEEIIYLGEFYSFSVIMMKFAHYTRMTIWTSASFPRDPLFISLLGKSKIFKFIKTKKMQLSHPRETGHGAWILWCIPGLGTEAQAALPLPTKRGQNIIRYYWILQSIFLLVLSYLSNKTRQMGKKSSPKFGIWSNLSPEMAKKVLIKRGNCHHNGWN